MTTDLWRYRCLCHRTSTQRTLDSVGIQVHPGRNCRKSVRDAAFRHCLPQAPRVRIEGIPPGTPCLYTSRRYGAPFSRQVGTPLSHLRTFRFKECRLGVKENTRWVAGEWRVSYSPGHHSNRFRSLQRSVTLRSTATPSTHSTSWNGAKASGVR
jgi:hypothetical protein